MSPVTVAPGEVRTVPPYDLNELPPDMGKLGRTFLQQASALGITLAPGLDPNWHIDSMD